jgi:WD40 repeat protein
MRELKRSIQIAFGVQKGFVMKLKFIGRDLGSLEDIGRMGSVKVSIGEVFGGMMTAGRTDFIKTPPALVLNSHTKDVTAVVFSPDGSSAASASGDKTVKVYLVKNGFTEAKTMTHHTNFVISLDYSENGGLLALGSIDKKSWWSSPWRHTAALFIRWLFRQIVFGCCPAMLMAPSSNTR